MTVLLILILLLLFAVNWGLLRDQIQTLDSRFRFSAKRDRTELERQIAVLAERVGNLEQKAQPTPTKSVGATMPYEPIYTAAFPTFAPPPSETPIPDALVESPELMPSVAQHAALQLSRKWLKRCEWEPLVAGNLLNKLGAFILVIGIALFLGYSFSLMQPVGRSALATLVSLSLLIGGLILENRPHYRLFARGLLGAGWAALYATAYAMYALPASQVITNPITGSLLLLTASACMIAHSLRYRVQVVTATAFFAAFAALAVTPSSPFAAVSLIPLSTSLLYFAWRFKWYPMGFYGLFATYGTYFAHGNANSSLYATTFLLMVYWALFEVFDIVRSWQGVQEACTTWIFPINTIAFLTLVDRIWSTHTPNALWQAAVGTALLFLFSALSRPGRLPVSDETAARNPFDSIRRGTYEAPLTMAAFLAGTAILGHAKGFWVYTSLAFEAELLYLAGLGWRSHFLRGLSYVGFLVSLGDLLVSPAASSSAMTILGHSLHDRTPSLLLHVGLFYINRLLSQAAVEFSFVATGLTAVIIISEFAPLPASLALFLFALTLFVVGWGKQHREFRIQSYLIALTAACQALWNGGWSPSTSFSVYGYFGSYALLNWLFTALILWLGEEERPGSEMASVRDVFATSGSIFAVMALWMMLPGTWISIAWAGLGLVWLAGASAWKTSSFRWLAAGVLGTGCIRLLFTNLGSLWAVQTSGERWMIPFIVVGSLCFFWHVFRHVLEEQQRLFAPAFTITATLIAVWLLYLGVHPLYLTGAWASLGLFLLAAGLRLHERTLRWQGYSAISLAFTACIVFNLTTSNGKEVLARIIGTALFIACLFATEFLLSGNVDALSIPELHARTLASLAAMLVLTGLLYREIPGSWLTVAWGLEALTCLGLGFPTRKKFLRWGGLSVFGLCILKLFFYDLRNLETAYRILSFIALGIFLLGVSLIYTRFRNQIQRFL